MAFAGLRTTSWVTDTGEVVREESPLGILTVREAADRATIMAVPGRVQTDLLEAAAVVPTLEPIRVLAGLSGAVAFAATIAANVGLCGAYG
jgi:hypothetical protein